MKTQHDPPLKTHHFFAPENDLIGRWSNLLLGFRPKFRCEPLGPGSVVHLCFCWNRHRGLDIKQVWHASIFLPPKTSEKAVGPMSLFSRLRNHLDTPKIPAEKWMLKSILIKSSSVYDWKNMFFSSQRCDEKVSKELAHLDWRKQTRGTKKRAKEKTFVYKKCEWKSSHGWWSIKNSSTGCGCFTSLVVSRLVGLKKSLKRP